MSSRVHKRNLKQFCFNCVFLSVFSKEICQFGAKPGLEESSPAAATVKYTITFSVPAFVEAQKDRQ